MLTPLLAVSICISIVGAQTVIPWRAYHAAFAVDKGVYFTGGTVDANQPPYVIPSAAGRPSPQQQAAQFRANSSVYFLSAADAGVARQSAPFPPLFGHSCAVDELNQVAYCTGGFRADARPPFRAQETMWIFDTRSENITSQNITYPALATNIPAVRGFHSSVFLDDFIYMFGGIDCLYCGLITLNSGAQTVQYNLRTGNATFFPVRGDAPATFVGSCSVKLSDNTILLIGGIQGLSSPLQPTMQMWIFDPKSQNQTFTPILDTTGTRPAPRWGLTCGKAADSNLVYVQGGCDTNGTQPVDPAMYTFDVGQKRWAVVQGSDRTGAGARCFAAGAMLNGFFVVHGGRTGGIVNATVPTGTSTIGGRPTVSGGASSSMPSGTAAVPTGSVILISPPGRQPQTRLPNQATPAPVPGGQPGGTMPSGIPADPSQSTLRPQSENGPTPAPQQPSQRPETSPPPNGNPQPSPGLDQQPNAVPNQRPEPRPEIEQWRGDEPVPWSDWEGGEVPNGRPEPNGGGDESVPWSDWDEDRPRPPPGQEADWSWRQPSWWPQGLNFPYGGVTRNQRPSALRPEPRPRPHPNYRSYPYQRRQFSTAPPTNASDSGIYVFDTKNQAWAAPPSLVVGQANPQPSAAPPAPAPPSTVSPPPHDNNNTSAQSEGAQKTRVKIIVSVLLVGMVVIAVGVGATLVYCRRIKEKRWYSSLVSQARRSGTARAYRVRPNSSDKPLPPPPTMDMPNARPLDPSRNVVIPLLAPVPLDGGSLGRGPWDSDDARNSRAMPKDLRNLQAEMGDIRRLTFESEGVPVRTDSVQLRKPPAEILQAGAGQEHVAHNVGDALAAGVTSALASTTSTPSGAVAPPASPTPTTAGYNLPQELLYVVVYPHLPRLPDEVELRPGDQVAVRKVYRDGWCRGRNLSNGQDGVFPLLAVEEADSWVEGEGEGEGGDAQMAYWDVGYGAGTEDQSQGQGLGLGLGADSFLLGTKDRGYGAVDRGLSDDTVYGGGDEQAAAPGDLTEAQKMKEQRMSLL